MPNPTPPPVLIVGAGLAGLTAAYELTRANQPVILIDQENAAHLGGQAFWSLGGIFLVDSAEQRFSGIRDSEKLARSDWFNSAQFDRIEDEDSQAVKWADAYLDFVRTGMRDYLRGLGMGFMPTVGWAERGGGQAGGHGNSVPRFHITWGTGPEVVRVFREPVLKAYKKGLVQFKYRHQVDEIIKDESGRAVGVRGTVLEDSDVERGVASTRIAKGTFELRGRAVVVSTGGIGGNVDMIKEMWPAKRLGGTVPRNFVIGVPAHVDGRMLKIAEGAGARIVNRDRMWHYTEGMHNWNSIWPNHGIRVIPGPSSLWLDATGKRFPPPFFPGCDTLATLKHIMSTGYDYSWFVLTKTILEKEFSLSGSEQNPDLTGKSVWLLLKRLFSGQEPVRKFRDHGVDFVVANNVADLVKGMNGLQRDGAPPLDLESVTKTIVERDDQLINPYTKDAQIMLIRNALSFRGDRMARVAKLHKLLDPKFGPLVAVRMNILTRKTLGGLQTNLDSQVLRPDGQVFEGLYAAGEVAGFGGGGLHGYNALEGTFLTGCIFSGMKAGKKLADEGRVERARL